MDRAVDKLEGKGYKREVNGLEGVCDMGSRGRRGLDRVG